MKISVKTFEFRVFPMETRFPFQYGIASMTELPHLFVRVNLEVGGTVATGIASEGLPPKWFTKSPDTIFEQDLPAMREMIDHAAEIATGFSGESFFDTWQHLYREQAKWATLKGHPPLLANLGVSLVERALLDGFCRAVERPFSDALRSNDFEIRAEEVDPVLAGFSPADLLPEKPLSKVIARHTIGLGDPLTDADVEEPLGDGLPHSLEQSVRSYGLRYFKIKICGDMERDLDRLAKIRGVLNRETNGDYRATFDGNEQFKDMDSFREHWEKYGEDSAVSSLLDHIIFVEQPVHRDHALDKGVIASLKRWEKKPPLIIDESDSEMCSCPRALELGYNGTSHKNCKGVLKGAINAMRLEQRRREGGEWILSGEDLANVGPVALLQDLAVMASLGVTHVERNGHHYFQGLSAFPAEMQEGVLTNHSDLYRRHEQGFPTLEIAGGELHVGSVVNAPFGVGWMPDVSGFDAW